MIFFHGGEEIYLIVRRVEKIFYTREKKKKDVRAGDNVRGRIRGIGIEEGRAILMLPVLASFAYSLLLFALCHACYDDVHVSVHIRHRILKRHSFHQSERHHERLFLTQWDDC